MKNIDYKSLFKDLYNSGEAIINETTKEVFEAQPGEIFEQCWADTVERRKFPKGWFISDLGNLLSVKKDKIQWLNKNRKSNNKISYKFMIDKEHGTQIRNVEEHNLVGLVHGSKRFGLADKLLAEKGIDAFGVNSSTEINAQGHHINGADNRPQNIQFVTDNVHILIGNAPKQEESDKKHYSYMKKLGKVMGQENPNAVTVVFTGETMDLKTGKWSNNGNVEVISTDKILLNAESLEVIQEFIKNIGA